MVLDIIMPVLDGWGVIKAVREEPRWNNLPVLAVTSLGDEETMQRGLESGFTDWETKLNKTRLLEKLGAMLKTGHGGYKL
jgi:two-component system chemotaxis sensor kinase CheA